MARPPERSLCPRPMVPGRAGRARARDDGQWYARARAGRRRARRRSAPGQFTCSTRSASARCRSRSAARPIGGPVLHTIRAVGAVTRALCAVEPGASSACADRSGHLADRGRAPGRRRRVVGGGIGLAPLRPASARARSPREYGRVAVLFGARTPEDLLYRPSSRRGRATLHVEVTVDAAGRLARPRRRRHEAARRVPRSTRRRARVPVRARGDDAVLGPGAARRGVPAERSTSRSSAT